MRIGNIEVYGIIYKITNKINGKCYIGQTIVGFNKRYNYHGKGIERIYNYHKSYKEYGKQYNDYLLKSIEKYGFDAFETTEIFDVAFSKKELDIKEKHYIKLYDCINNGYNFTDGGGNGSPSKEVRKRLSEAHKGKKISEQTKQLWSKQRKGNIPWNKGKSGYNKKNPEDNNSIKNPNANLYKVIDLEGNEKIMCGTEIYNHTQQGFLDINKKTFEKYIMPYGEINIENIKPKSMNQYIKLLIEKLTPYNGWKIIKVN